MLGVAWIRVLVALPGLLASPFDAIRWPVAITAMGRVWWSYYGRLGGQSML